MWPRPFRSASRTNTSSSRSDAPDQPFGGSGRQIGLDVVRATAIAMVLVSHCSDMFASWAGGQAPAWLSLSGMFGVELFFVLSGFLIGRLLLRIVAQPPTLRHWAVFMVRRWMRTLPAYLIWLLVLALVWPPRFWEAGHTRLTWRHVVSYATLTQNLAWPMPDGWFGVSWSLTVEEWFYLTFSALLMGAVAVLGRRPGFLAAMSLFLAVPLALRFGMPLGADFGEVVSKIVVLRLDAIAFGVVLAWMEAEGSLPFRRPTAMLMVGVLLILSVWSGWLMRHVPVGPRVQRALLFDVVSAGFALCLPAAGRLRRLPAPLAAVLTAVSTQSYGMYLVHLSLLEMAGYYRVEWSAPVWSAIAFSLAGTWLLSWASWRWIERPILARRPAQFGRSTAGALARG